MFFSCVKKNKKVENVASLESKFIDFSIDRMNKITLDNALPQYYKRRVESAYLSSINSVSKNEKIKESDANIIRIDMEEGDFQRFYGLFNSSNESNYKY